jgi:hypothetical protein
MQMPARGGRKIGGGMQVGAFGFQPGRRIVQLRQVGDTGRRVARGGWPWAAVASRMCRPAASVVCR